MKPQNLHAHEDRLLDFAYGELPQAEAHAMEAHLQGCVRCSEALDGIRGVRSTMSQLSAEPAPDAGLDSLLAYAQQAARRAAAGPEPTPRWWRRWLMPAMGLTAVSFFGIFSLQVSKGVDLKPDLSEAVHREAAQEARAKDSAQVKAEAAAPQAVAPADKEAPSARPPPPPSPMGAMVQQQAPMPEAKEVAKLAELPVPERSVRAKKSKASWSADWSNAGTAYREQRADSNSRDEGLAAVGTRGELLADAPAQVEAAAPAPSQPPAQAVALNEQTVTEAEPSADLDAKAEEASAEREERVPESQAPKYAPPRSSLRLGGSPVQRGGAMSTAASGAVTAANMEPPATAGGVASAAPMPSKPSAAAPTSPAESDDTFDSLFTSKRGARKADAAGPSTGTLSQRASDAYETGDRALEANLLRQALAAGATGRERINLLVRLCDAEFALGRDDAAMEACGRVLSEDPDSNAAQLARRRLEQESRESMRSKKAAPARAAPVPVKK